MAGIAVVAVPAPTEVPLYREPVLLLPRSPRLLLFPGLLRRPCTCLFSLARRLKRTLTFSCLFLQVGLLSSDPGFLLGPQLGLFGFSFGLFRCHNLSIKLFPCLLEFLSGQHRWWWWLEVKSEQFFDVPRLFHACYLSCSAKLRYRRSCGARSRRGILLHSV